jgi:hypothetical protein
MDVGHLNLYFPLRDGGMARLRAMGLSGPAGQGGVFPEYLLP